MSDRNVKLIGYIDEIYRIASSRFGNPRYEVIINVSGGQSIRKTAPDSMIGYAITNPEYRGVPVLFTFNANGDIVSAMPLGSDSQVITIRDDQDNTLAYDPITREWSESYMDEIQKNKSVYFWTDKLENGSDLERDIARQMLEWLSTIEPTPTASEVTSRAAREVQRHDLIWNGIPRR